MGAFFKAFWGRLGRNTGNRVSNAIFGDKWSTPYRVAVDKNKEASRRSQRSSKRQETEYTQPQRKGHRNRQKSDTSRTGWGYWIAGIILFAGTYNAIVNPNKDDIVLLVMLWIVAIIFIFYKSQFKRK